MLNTVYVISYYQLNKSSTAQCKVISNDKSRYFAATAH